MEVRSTPGAVSFLLPRAAAPFRDRHAALFAALADAGCSVSELLIEDGVLTMEQALFALANEMRESDVIVLVDERSDAYDFVELGARSQDCFPAARIALVMEQSAATAPAVFAQAPTLHLATRG